MKVIPTLKKSEPLGLDASNLEKPKTEKADAGAQLAGTNTEHHKAAA